MNRKQKRHYGCKEHHQVFFTEEALQSHLKEKCHPENIVLLDDDFLGHMSYNIIFESIDNSNLSEQEKQSARDAYLW